MIRANLAIKLAKQHKHSQTHTIYTEVEMGIKSCLVTPIYQVMLNHKPHSFTLLLLSFAAQNPKPFHSFSKEYGFQRCC